MRIQAAVGTTLTSSPMRLCLKDEVTLPVTLHVSGYCLEPEVSPSAAGRGALVQVPVVLRVEAEPEGCAAPAPVELRLVLSGRVDGSGPFKAVQRLQVALPVEVTAALVAQGLTIMPKGDPERWPAAAWHKERTQHSYGK